MSSIFVKKDSKNKGVINISVSLELKDRIKRIKERLKKDDKLKFDLNNIIAENIEKIVTKAERELNENIADKLVDIDSEGDSKESVTY